MPVVDRDPETHQVVDGYQITAVDGEHGAPVKVFVPKDKGTPEYAHALIQHELGKVHTFKQLPGSLPAA